MAGHVLITIDHLIGMEIKLINCDIYSLYFSYSESCSIKFILQLYSLLGLNAVILPIIFSSFCDTASRHSGRRSYCSHARSHFIEAIETNSPSSYEGGSPLRYLCLLICRCNNNLLGDNCITELMYMNNINFKF